MLTTVFPLKIRNVTVKVATDQSKNRYNPYDINAPKYDNIFLFHEILHKEIVACAPRNDPVDMWLIKLCHCEQSVAILFLVKTASISSAIRYTTICE